MGLKDKYPISAICKVIQVPRSLIYYKPKPKPSNLELEDQIESIFKASRGNYGTRKIKYELQRQNVTVSRRRIGQIMKKRSLTSNYAHGRPKYTKISCNEDDIPNILNRDFKRDDELDVVVSDLTYVRVAGAWHYVCLVVDLWNREIIGYAAGKNKTSELVYQAITSIHYSLNRINIFHSDRGNEFKNYLIDEVIDTFHLKRSLSRKGTPLDNAVIESTNHILKTEFIYQHHFSSLEELKYLLADYVHWYNHHRIHGAIGYLTPIQYRTQYGNTKTNLLYQSSRTTDS